MTKQRRKKRVFSKEFKAEAVKLVLEQGMTRVQVAQDLDLAQQQVSSWIRDYRLASQEAFPGHGQLSAQVQRIKDLETENSRLKMERDILKKATAFFANHEE